MLQLERAWVEIDLQAIARNYDAICKMAGTQVMPVIKADAYGHGAVRVAQTLQRKGVQTFAVSNLQEALELREAGITADILVLGYTPVEYAALLEKHAVIQTLFSSAYAVLLEEACVRQNVCVRTHLKLDTGMGRIGFDCRTDTQNGFEEVCAALSLPHLKNEGVFMHFASADSDAEEDARFSEKQYAIFEKAVKRLEQDGFTFKMKHCSNSAAILQYPRMHLDAVRAGIILYGLAPSDALSLDAAFTPAMTFRAVISMVKDVDVGETVSYGRTYTANEKRRIATVSAGYADGVPRLLSNVGEVEIGGKRAAIVGRVCMDQFCIDVTDIPNVAVGDIVTVFGKNLSAGDVAKHAQTIHYEIVCGITKRVPRVYVDEM